MRGPVPRNRFFDTTTTLGRVLAFLSVSALCAVLVAGLMSPAMALTGNAAQGATDALSTAVPSDLTSTQPGQASRIVAADGSVIATLFSENRTDVTLDQMSPNIKNAIVAIEDYRFYQHGGIDSLGILRALATDAGGGRQGASTLTQQYVTNALNEQLIAKATSSEEPTWPR